MEHKKKYQNGGKLDEDKKNRRKKKRRIRKLKEQLKRSGKGAIITPELRRAASKGAAKGVKGLGMKRMENGGKMKKIKKKTIADQSRYQAMDFTKGGKSTGRAQEYGEGRTVKGTLREATSSGRRNIFGAIRKNVKKDGFYDIMDKKSKKGLHSRDKAGGSIPMGKKSKGEKRRLKREDKRMTRKARR